MRTLHPRPSFVQRGNDTTYFCSSLQTIHLHKNIPNRVGYSKTRTIKETRIGYQGPRNIGLSETYYKLSLTEIHKFEILALASAHYLNGKKGLKVTLAKVEVYARATQSVTAQSDQGSLLQWRK